MADVGQPSTEAAGSSCSFTLRLAPPWLLRAPPDCAPRRTRPGLLISAPVRGHLPASWAVPLGPRMTDQQTHLLTALASYHDTNKSGWEAQGLAKGRGEATQLGLRVLGQRTCGGHRRGRGGGRGTDLLTLARGLAASSPASATLATSPGLQGGGLAAHLHSSLGLR